jgi:hypothetical protein
LISPTVGSLPKNSRRRCAAFSDRACSVRFMHSAKRSKTSSSNHVIAYAFFSHFETDHGS